MAEKKLVIKINQERIKPKPDAVDMITEWNIPRLVMAAIFILLVIFLFVIVFAWDSGPDQVTGQDITQSGSRQLPAVIDKPVDQKLLPESKIKKESNFLISKTNSSDTSLVDPDEEEVNQFRSANNKVTIHILDKRISRAVISAGLSEKEPVNIITGPVIANKNKAVGVYFFSEINKMKGKVLYHEWYRNNKLIFKRRINRLLKNAPMPPAPALHFGLNLPLDGLISQVFRYQPVYIALSRLYFRLLADFRHNGACAVE